MIREWFFGFFNRSWKEPSLWFGHCEAWGWMDDGTWVFVDPQGKGMRIYTRHLYDDVAAEMQARVNLCDDILILENPGGEFRLPLHGPMTCAAVCGSLVGVRALTPGGLRRSLLAKGARVFHEATERGSG